MAGSCRRHRPSTPSTRPGRSGRRRPRPTPCSRSRPAGRRRRASLLFIAERGEADAVERADQVDVDDPANRSRSCGVPFLPIVRAARPDAGAVHERLERPHRGGGDGRRRTGRRRSRRRQRRSRRSPWRAARPVLLAVEVHHHDLDARSANSERWPPRGRAPPVTVRETVDLSRGSLNLTAHRAPTRACRKGEADPRQSRRASRSGSDAFGIEQRSTSTSDWDFGFDFGAVTEPSDEQTDRGDDVPADDGPIRKGGGPPGRSTFLPGGRLRRLAEELARRRTGRGATGVATTLPAAFDEGRQIEEQPVRPIKQVVDPDPEWSPEAFSDKLVTCSRRAAACSTPTPDNTSPSTWVRWTTPARVAVQLPIAEAPTTTEAPRPPAGRTFPGGRAKLPRLNPTAMPRPGRAACRRPSSPGHGSDEDGAAIAPASTATTRPSLFAPDARAIADPLTKPADEDAYAVLGDLAPRPTGRSSCGPIASWSRPTTPTACAAAVAVRPGQGGRLRQINLALPRGEGTPPRGRPTPPSFGQFGVRGRG